MKIGLIGAGSLGSFHAVRWRQLGASVDAVYDTVPTSAEQAAAETGATICGSVAEVVQRVDVVDVCTPPTAHREPTIAALEAGRPVICEKPLARTWDDALSMVRASETTGVPLYVAHVVRFFPEFARVHDVVATGGIGKPGVYRSSRVGSLPRWGTWFADEAQSGGVLLDVMVHDFDFARWCCGEVERIFVRRARWSGEPGGEHAFALLRFKGGAIGHIEGGWSRPPGNFFTHVEIAGDGGLVEVKSDKERTIQARLHSGEPITFENQPADDPYLAELRHFKECIETGRPPLVTARDALAALQISLAGIESARTGKPIALATA
jgi:UDP-N-acetylglucosamine 3-dehydrogenase